MRQKGPIDVRFIEDEYVVGRTEFYGTLKMRFVYFPVRFLTLEFHALRMDGATRAPPANRDNPREAGVDNGCRFRMIDRLLDKGAVSRVESPRDRRVRIVSLASSGKELIPPVFRKHAAEIAKVFADASPKELRTLETILKKIGKRAENLATGAKPRS